MEIFDNLAKGVKDFFVEAEDGDAAKPAASVPAAGPFVMPNTGQFAAPGQFATPVVQAEQRHLDHIAGLLVGNGKDFETYLKMVKSMAAAGMSGGLLYQTAFNAFAAVSGVTVNDLLTSANQFEEALTTDRDKVLARHREKMGETAPGAGSPSPVVQLAEKERRLAADLADLSQQLQNKQQQLVETQQQLATERQKTQAALASYELAQSAALTELQAHHKAAEAFLLSSNPK